MGRFSREITLPTAVDCGYKGVLVKWRALQAAFVPLPWIYGHDSNVYIERDQVVIAPSDWGNKAFGLLGGQAIPALPDEPPPEAVRQMQMDALSANSPKAHTEDMTPREVPPGLKTGPEPTPVKPPVEKDGHPMGEDARWSGPGGTAKLRKYLKTEWGLSAPGNTKHATLLKKLAAVETNDARSV